MPLCSTASASCNAPASRLWRCRPPPPGGVVREAHKGFSGSGGGGRSALDIIRRDVQPCACPMPSLFRGHLEAAEIFFDFALRPDCFSNLKRVLPGAISPPCSHFTICCTTNGFQSLSCFFTFHVNLPRGERASCSKILSCTLSYLARSHPCRGNMERFVTALNITPDILLACCRSGPRSFQASRSSA